MKNNIIVVLILALIIVGSIFEVYLYQSKQNSNIAYLNQHGRELGADIVELRRYFPPQDLEKYGRVFYEYVTPSGKPYKNQSWLSENQYKQLTGKSSLTILYDPSQPKNSMPKK